MSLRAILETLLHVESFRNIDLFNQGLYALRYTLSYSQHGFSFVSAPLDTDSLKNARRSKRMIDPHNIKSCETNDYTSSFTSRTFLIRYMEEDVKLNDFCTFRLEIDVEPNYVETPLFLKIELLFADLVSSVANELLNSSVPFPDYPMTVVATSELRINYSLHGVQEFVPVTFNEIFYCVSNTIITCTLVGFQMRMHPLTPAGTDIKRPKMQVDLDEMWYEALFPKMPPESILTTEQVERIFKNHVGFLGIHYKQLRDFITEVYYSCLNDKRREAFDINRMPGPLFPSVDPDHPENDGEEINKVLERRLAAMDSYKTAQAVAKKLIEETSILSAHVCQLLHTLRELLKTSPKAIRQFMQEKHYQRVKERWGESIFRENTPTPEFPFSTEKEIGQMHNTIAISRRNNKYYRRLTPMSVEQIGIFPKPDQHPILFEEVFDRGTSNESCLSDGAPQPFGVHLFVLVHGFQGNSFDMRLFKNNLALIYPDAVFLCSSINETNTDGPIEEMGQNLAREITCFIEESCPLSSIGRASFIGHSLGGLIIRAALPQLEMLSSRMHAYISLSTPHLGYLSNASRLVNMGLWVLKKWRKSTCLKQLSLTDCQNPSQSFLFELSQYSGMEWFRHVVLLSSAQDSYAPFDSARLEVSSSTAQDPTLGGLYLQMSGNIVSRIKADQLHRLDVNFKISERNVDTMIGRKAHIMFLENEPLMRMMVHCYPKFFS
mmetsp:Transcript_26450/g.47462  ORF Transcript_26450/g.47462 Transcript_26450/m.47462 type:complete len:719 (+) Transcript_26450:1037-3193(+)